MVLRTQDGGITISMPIRVRRYSGRRQVLVPQGISAVLKATCAPTALQLALARVAMNTPLCWAAQRRRIAEVVAGAGERKTRAIART